MSTGNLKSTPHRESTKSHISSAPISTGDDNPSYTNVLKQEDLISLVKKEIGGHVWQFPIDEITRMLSPRDLKAGLTPEKNRLSEHFNFQVDELFFKEALGHATTLIAERYTNSLKHKASKNAWPPSHRAEKAFYQPFTTFLNQCLEVCSAALDRCVDSGAPPLYERLYQRLRFYMASERTVGDRVEGAAPLKSDIRGTTDYHPGEKFFWCPPNGTENNMIHVPVEIKEDDGAMIAQCGTYGRCPSPSRTFSLVISFNQRTSMFRFLIFHRSGLTCNEPVNITTVAGRTKCLKLFLTVLLWTTPRHAGFDPSCNDLEYFIPVSKDDTEGQKVTVQGVLYSSLCIRGRATCVSRVCSTVPTPQPLDPLQLEPPEEATPSPGPSTVTTPQRVSPLSQDPIKLQEDIGTRRSSRLAVTQVVGDAAPGRGDLSGGRAAGGQQTGASAHTARSPLASNEGASGNSETRSKETKGHGEDKENVPVMIHSHKRSITYCQPRVCVFPRDDKLSELLSPKDGESSRAANQENTCPNNLAPSLPPTAILKSFWPENSRKDVERDMLSAIAGLFGTATAVAYWEVVFENGEAVATDIFLPTSAEAPKYFWNIFSSDCPKPEGRTLVRGLLETFGEGLVTARSSWELLENVMHAMLGWLNIYQAGYVHRDISIGNILRLPVPISLQEFCVSEIFQKPESFLNPEAVTSALGGLSLEEDEEENPFSIDGSSTPVETHSKHLLRLLRDLDVATTCSAFVIDGDMSVKWREYLQNDKEKGQRSGTVEFMSSALRTVMSSSDGYLQTPVDDLESFFWVTLWAVLFNVHNKSRRTKLEQGWQSKLRGNVDARNSVLLGMLLEDMQVAETSPILRHLTPVLRLWHPKLVELQNDWKRFHKVAQLGLEPDLWLTYWHRFAFRGVCDFVEIVQQHKERLKARPLFIAAP